MGVSSFIIANDLQLEQRAAKCAGYATAIYVRGLEFPSKVKERKSVPQVRTRSGRMP